VSGSRPAGSSSHPARRPGNEVSTFSYLLRNAFYRAAFSLARRGAVKIIPVKEVSSLADGEVMDVPGSPRALHTPGHTPGSAAIAVESAMRSWQVMPCAPGIPTPAGSARRSCHPRCT
jgi:hypothetical protein